MRIIISPAKKMKADPDSLPWRDLPRFVDRTQQLLDRLRAMQPAELKKLWKCSDAIVEENLHRLERMDLHRGLTPAILSYEGIQYRYMAPDVFTDAQFAYIQEHLRILSGFYGLLRPFDGVTPYRLEMQAKLPVGENADLYAYWGGDLARALWAQTDCVVNLASKEYSVCAAKYQPAGTRFVTCVFAQPGKDGRIVEKATLCKMARGEMVRYMAENGITRPEDLRGFDRLNFAWSAEHSDAQRLVFLQETAKK